MLINAKMQTFAFRLLIVSCPQSKAFLSLVILKSEIFVCLRSMLSGYKQVSYIYKQEQN